MKSLIALMVCLVCLFSLPYASAQDNAMISQRDFALLLYDAKQLDSRLAGSPGLYKSSMYGNQSDMSTIQEKVALLEKLGYAPDGGYKLEKSLTMSEFSVTMVKVLRLQSQLPANPSTQDFINVLTKQGIVATAGTTHPLTKVDVLDAFKKAKLPVPTQGGTKLPAYTGPFSSTE